MRIGLFCRAPRRARSKTKSLASIGSIRPTLWLLRNTALNSMQYALIPFRIPRTEPDVFCALTVGQAKLLYKGERLQNGDKLVCLFSTYRKTTLGPSCH